MINERTLPKKARFAIAVQPAFLPLYAMAIAFCLTILTLSSPAFEQCESGKEEEGVDHLCQLDTENPSGVNGNLVS